MRALIPPTLATALLLAAAIPALAEDEPAKPVSLNYKIELRCKFGDSPEQVFRLTDATGEFEAEHPDPPILFSGKLGRREGKAFLLAYHCAWRQDIKEAPRDPANPKVPKGQGSYKEGSVKGTARVAKGRPVEVFDADRSKVTITLLEVREVPDSNLERVEIRPAKKIAEK